MRGPVKGKENSQFQIGKEVMQASAFVAVNSMGTSKRGNVPGVDERLIVRPMALATAFPDPLVYLSLIQSLVSP
jgi:hypothetical protein